MYVRPSRRSLSLAAATALLGLALTLAGGTAALARSSAEPAAGTPARPALPGEPGALPGRLGAPTVFAHRGASAYAPENTLAAVDHADGLGIDWVENDVQRTRDGELVVVHDETLARTTDAEQVFPDRSPWRVADFTAAEIARLDAGSWFGAAFAGARVPTLREYLDRLERNGQRLLLEIKLPALYPGIEGDTLRVLEEAGWLDRRHVTRRLVVQSFAADSIRAVHALRPDLTTAFLGTPAVADLPAYAAFTDRINPWYGGISAEWVAAVHDLTGPHGRRLEVDAWTVDNADVAVRMADLGVDGIITNRPDRIRDAVAGR
ncbi:glycerophosphodiester phosphodiesterase [Streptomyces sp. NPDC086023]|uniref:glycerophosphodiester phosphodiesterase n=1 Tax=Streptomyces sp. NPDC086023 TaxID=3365746 RepID=UPI0037CD5FF9